jgi:hypothetical protein
MPVIRIPDPVFERLQGIATPLVDTPASVIEKLLDFYDSHGELRARVTSATRVQPEPTAGTSAFNVEAPPDLHHTRVLSARFDGQTASNWNDLVHVAHRQALERFGSFDELRSVSLSKIASGRRSDSGYHPVADLNLSVQNVDSNLAWRNTVNLAQRLRVPVEVEFEWRQAEGAANPGRRGSMAWAPPPRERSSPA